MARIGLCAALAIGISIGLIFAFDPLLDLKVARWLYAWRSSGAVAPWRPLLGFLRDFNMYLTPILIGLSVVALIARALFAKTAILPSVRAAALILVVFVVGPGLAANLAFKDNWGRPRPGAVLTGGGDQLYKAWWDPRGTCPKDCSFVSGETSSAFAVFAVAVLVPLGWRYTAVFAALLFGAAIGAMRVIVGAHFVTDVVFAGVLMAIVVWAMHGLIYRWSATRVSEQQAEVLIDNGAAWLRDTAMLAFRRMRIGFRSFIGRAAVAASVTRAALSQAADRPVSG